MGMPPNSPHAKPALAGFLGLIPGVGAMYNGQFMKGLIHLGLFVVIVAVTDKIGPIMIPVYFAYFFYCIFDAYKTAQALEQGLPLPDPFGLERAFGTNVNQTSWHRPPVAPSQTAGGAPGVPWDPAQAAQQQAAYAAQEAGACASNVHGVPIGAVILIGLGCLFLLHTLDLFTFDLGRLWPIILIVIGAWMFVNRWTRRVS
jgi:TM2 domain-containing membrane protein YozV